MSPSSPTHAASDQSSLPPKILESRQQYHPCHIYLPGETKRLPAIVVEGEYYSLFKIAKGPQQALEICQRLASKRSRTVITRTPKGDAIWVFEPDAYTDPAELSSASENSLMPRILESRHQYQTCHVWVPDIDRRLAAIQIDQEFYGLLKVVKTRQRALELAMKLQQRGDKVIITKAAQGDALWVLEPEAKPDEKLPIS